MSKFFTGQKTEVTLAEVNVIPLVDIVFTLLIIFMIMAPMIHKGIEVQVPESAVGEAVPEQSQHIVSITEEGLIWFDTQETSLENLKDHLQNLPAEEIIYVQADTAIAYGRVIEVISEIKTSGLRNVGLVTNPKKP